MLPFTLIGQPGYDDALRLLGPDRELELLVLYHGELSLRDFLGRILTAAGYEEPGRQLHLLEWGADRPLDLSGLVRTLGVRRVLLFGYDPAALGVHLQLPNYRAATLAGITYLLADSLEYISQAKEAGDNRAAGALWSAMKQHFLRQPG